VEKELDDEVTISEFKNYRLQLIEYFSMQIDKFYSEITSNNAKLTYRKMNAIQKKIAFRILKPTKRKEK